MLELVSNSLKYRRDMRVGRIFGLMVGDYSLDCSVKNVFFPFQIEQNVVHIYFNEAACLKLVFNMLETVYLF